MTQGLEVPTGTSITLQIATAKSGEVYSKTFRYNDLLGFDPDLADLPRQDRAEEEC
ncbi:MAG: hypothetical protein U1F21_07595 [Sphaerotilus natans]